MWRRSAPDSAAASSAPSIPDERQPRCAGGKGGTDGASGTLSPGSRESVAPARTLAAAHRRAVLTSPAAHR